MDDDYSYYSDDADDEEDNLVVNTSCFAVFHPMNLLDLGTFDGSSLEFPGRLVEKKIWLLNAPQKN